MSKLPAKHISRGVLIAQLEEAKDLLLPHARPADQITTLVTRLDQTLDRLRAGWTVDILRE